MASTQWRRRSRRQLPIKKGALVKERKQKHHVSWLLPPKSCKVDVATPIQPLKQSVRRCAMRRLRQRAGVAAVPPTDVHNNATRAALRCAYQCKGRPAGIERPQWVSNLTVVEVPTVVGDVSWCALQSRVASRCGTTRSHLFCPMCKASASKQDWCGAALIPDMQPVAFAELFNYIMHECNVLGGLLDPEDQRLLQESMAILSEQTLQHPVDETSAMKLGVRVCLYLSIVASEKSVPFVKQALLAADLRHLCRAIGAVPKGGLYRGGQRPYKLGSTGLVNAIARFEVTSSDRLAELLLLRKKSSSKTVQAEAAYDIVELVTTCDLPFFGPYRQKRFLELLALAGTCGFAGMTLKEEDFDVALDIWPLPGNTICGLRRIFPTASTAALQRQGLRLLVRTVRRHGTKTVTVCRMSALLCFGAKESAGIMKLTRRR